MKMAKASQNDLELGLAITSVIESCERERGIQRAEREYEARIYRDRG